MFARAKEFPSAGDAVRETAIESEEAAGGIFAQGDDDCIGLYVLGQGMRISGDSPPTSTWSTDGHNLNLHAAPTAVRRIQGH